MKKRISRFGLFVPDLGKAVTFYQNLGFEKTGEAEIPAMKIAFVSFEGQLLELIEKTNDVPFHKDGVLNHITFDVDDIQEAVKEFTEAGATIFVEPMSLGTGTGYVAFGYGASGEVIELFQEG
jgi:predicted enzyme related to lactoylglutathione lyase